MCGATSYRPVVARGSADEMRQTGLYQCSGCSVVFVDPKAWRDGGIDAVEANPSSVTLLTPLRATPVTPVTPAQGISSTPASHGQSSQSGRLAGRARPAP